MRPAPEAPHPASAPTTRDHTPHGTTQAGTLTLASLRHGQQARIHAVSHQRGPHIARRLADLGLEPGRTITVERRAPMGDPTVYHVADYHISLRARDAALITVHLEDETR